MFRNCGSNLCEIVRRSCVVLIALCLLLSLGGSTRGVSAAGVDCSLSVTTPYKAYSGGHWVVASKSHIGAELGCSAVNVTHEIIFVSGDYGIIVAKAPLVQVGYTKAHYQTIYGDLPFCGSTSDYGDFFSRLHVETGDGSAFWDIDSEVHTVQMNC